VGGAEGGLGRSSCSRGIGEEMVWLESRQVASNGRVRRKRARAHLEPLIPSDSSVLKCTAGDSPLLPSTWSGSQLLICGSSPICQG
jgi:hypothetical protein